MAMVEVEGDNTELDAVPSATYRTQVTKCAVVTAASGKPNAQWEGDIVGHPEYSGRKLFWNTSLQPQALWKLADVLDKFRVPHERTDLGDKKLKVRFDPDTCVGHTARLAVSVVPAKNKDGTIKEGKMRNEVEEFMYDD